MSEILGIAREWKRVGEQGRGAALATVVAAHGSTFRRAGARMLVLDDGTTFGSVSGGCLESSVIEAATEVIRTGVSRTLRYSGDEDDLVLGEGAMCDGEVVIVVEAVDRDLGQILDQVRETLPSSDLSLEIAEVPSRGARTRFGREESDPAPVIFRERVLSPVRLVLCGAGALAGAVSRIAEDLGWSVTVVDHRPHFLEGMPVQTAEVRAAGEIDAFLHRPSRTAVVVMTHHFERDAALVERALRFAPFYVGLLGSRGRSGRIIAALNQRGLDTRGLYAPVGLEIGSETIEEIALSIVAEIQSVRRSATGGSLRDSGDAVHGRRSSRIAGVVLAAGGSSRMGRSKLGLPGLSGQSILAETIDRLSALELADLLVVTGADDGAHAIARTKGARTVPNPDWPEGLGASLRAAVAALGDEIEGVLICLGDQPGVKESDLQRLARVWRAGNAPAVATRYPEGGGVPAVLSRTLFEDLATLEGDRGARDLIRTLEGVELVEDVDVRDLDEPSDYEALGPCRLPAAESD